MIDNHKLIYAHLHVPDKKNERPYVEEIYCSFPECPLLKENKCIHRQILERCIYGRTSRNEASSSLRGRGGYQFVKEYKQRFANKEFPVSLEGYYDDCMVVLKDYIYLPYPHMNHLDGEKKAIPFLSYSHVFSSGSKFMKLEDFTVDTVVAITLLRPMSLMGGEITDYQNKHLPLFLFHLKKIMPDLYNRALEKCSIIHVKTLKIDNIEFLEIPLSSLPDGKYGDSPYVSFGKGARIESWEKGNLHVYGTREEIDNISYFLHCKDKTNMDLIFIPIPDKIKIKVFKSELLNSIIEKNPELVNK